MRLIGPRLLVSCVLAAVIAGTPLLPWYKLGLDVQPTVEWLTVPGIVFAYLFAGPHNLTTRMVTIADFALYWAAGLLFLTLFHKRRMRKSIRPDDGK